jgi:hypothetical protein
MVSHSFRLRLTSCVILSLFITGLIFLTLPPSFASATNGISSPQKNYYFIQISQPKSPVCVGESRKITVSWDTEPFSALAPLVPSNIKDPLPVTGPRVLYAQTPRKGEMDRYTMHPAGPSGTTTFTYIANHEGPEVLIFQAMDDNLQNVSQNEVTFDVKKCDYQFELFGQLDADASSEDVVLTFNYVLRAKGLLKEDPNRPGYFEANSVKITLETNVLTFSTPECVLFTYTPGYGEGTVDVKAEQLGNENVVVRFSPPQDLVWKYDWQAACDGKPISLNMQFPETGNSDPWIEATLPSGSGLQNIRLEKFEEGVNNFKRAGLPASYTAFVYLTRVQPK